jgi:hypothetical protein
LSYIATPFEVVDREKILAVKKSMLDDIFYEGKPFFSKATQNIKYIGIGCQLTRKRQLLLNNSTTLHKPERSY